MFFLLSWQTTVRVALDRSFRAMALKEPVRLGGECGLYVHICPYVFVKQTFLEEHLLVHIRNEEYSCRNASLACRFYSWRKLSTGSSCEARVAGTVPKIMPTIDDTTMAMIADKPEIGMRKSVRKRTE